MLNTVKKETFKITNGVATVFQDPDEPTDHYLTRERGNHRGVVKLEATTWAEALIEAKEMIK